jgi:transposase
LGHGWFEKGKRIPVKIKIGFKNFYLYSAISPKKGTTFSLIMPKVNTESMNVFLQEMSKALEKKKALLIMDGAGWHKTKKLVIPDNIKVTFLPPYSPELNPVERYWEYIKTNVLKNKLYEDLQTLEDTVCNFINSLTPLTVRSVCNVTYLSHY